MELSSQYVIPFKRMSGLRPSGWLCVGSGFAREDIKALILSQGLGFTSEAIVTLQEICLNIIQISSSRMLSTSARQEILKMLLAEPKIIADLHELKRIRRQRDFIRRLDLAIQAGRLAFAHSQEEEVYQDRLSQSLGENPLRKELQILTLAYEAWLEATSSMDLPVLMRKATEVLREGWPSYLSMPQEVFSLSVQKPESLEREFWEVLGQHVEIRFIHSLCDSWSNQPSLEWQKWHTLEDASEYLADQIELSPTDTNWDDHAILIPDVPSVRRSLRRALESRGLPLADPRDPTRLRWDEALKWALLPLEVVGRNFERQKVISWLRGYQMQAEFPAWVNEINVRGIRHGLSSYTGGMLQGVHSRLSELEAELGGRRTCAELSEAHLKFLRSNMGSNVDSNLWLISFLEQTWKAFESDLTRIEQSEKKAPLLFWLERLQDRLGEASPPVERLKPRTGIRLYRLQQAPVMAASKVWIFGLPSRWFDGEGTRSYWFNEREREILAIEFAVRSSVQVREERIHVLKSWISGAEKVVILDSQYDTEGRERESILPILKELELNLKQTFPQGVSEIPIEMGSHPRFLKSYQAIRPIQPQVIQLSPLKEYRGVEIPELTATSIDRYSRCPFQALAFHRWNLRDIREPDSELWPDVRGNILHESVRLLLESRNAGGGFDLTPLEALERAWKRKRPKGLIKSTRVEHYVKSRMCILLEIFCEKERKYLAQSGATPVSLDDIHLRIQYPEFSIVGQPDRIDRHQDGLFIIDYKSSGTVPHGSEMIEQGYRLQLPFYAVAVRKKTNEPTLGVQFIELDRKGSRKSGIFFKEHNGKDAGKLTNVRSNSKSLIHLPPEEVWEKLEEQLIQNAQGFIKGQFEARPRITKREKECARCSVADLCGLRRLVESGTEGEGSGE